MPLSIEIISMIIVPRGVTGTPSRQIVQPLEKLEAKYFSLGRAWCYASRDFDLYVAQRQVNPNWRCRIDGADLYATCLMNSGVRKIEVDDFMQRVNEIEASLAQVPDVDLGAVSLSDLSQQLRTLFALCRRPGFSIAKVTKLLCQKRPGLIPMLDGWVLDALGVATGQSPPDPEVFAERVVDAVARFQAVLNWTDPDSGSNLATLQQLASTLSQSLAASLQADGVLPPYPQFTATRILDNLLWFDAWGYRYYGFQQVGGKVIAPTG